MKQQGANLDKTVIGDADDDNWQHFSSSNTRCVVRATLVVFAIAPLIVIKYSHIINIVLIVDPILVRNDKIGIMKKDWCT